MAERISGTRRNTGRDCYREMRYEERSWEMTGRRRAMARKNVKKRLHRAKVIKRFCTFAAELALILGLIIAVRNIGKPSAEAKGASGQGGMSVGIEGISLRADVAMGTDAYYRTVAERYPDMDLKEYPEKLIELLALNEEAVDYVKSYPERQVYQNQSVDLAQDIQQGQVPFLMQWDRRWGYDAYGDDIIGLSGCGPVCLDMAYLYFTGDIGMTPREMAGFAYDNGYYVDGGTSWSLWTEGTAQLGLSGKELPLDENRMRQALDAGGLIVCSMRPGDFTTTGHFILIRGYDDNGFWVNDPNRRSNSERQWDFDTLRGQIKNLWALGR